MSYLLIFLLTDVTLRTLLSRQGKIADVGGNFSRRSSNKRFKEGLNFYETPGSPRSYCQNEVEKLGFLWLVKVFKRMGRISEKRFSVCSVHD